MAWHGRNVGGERRGIGPGKTRIVGKEVACGAANTLGMDAHERLVHRVADEQDDILGTIQLIDGDPELQDRLFEQLVDLLVEGMFLDLREEYLRGDLDRGAYVDALAHLADRCRQVGLLPLPSRNS
jgi:hypothetical protein